MPLAGAYRYGAKNWTKQTRVELANDEMNLTPTTAAINRTKADKDPAMADARGAPESRCRWRNIKDQDSVMDGPHTSATGSAMNKQDRRADRSGTSPGPRLIRCRRRMAARRVPDGEGDSGGRGGDHRHPPSVGGSLPGRPGRDDGGERGMAGAQSAQRVSVRDKHGPCSGPGSPPRVSISGRHRGSTRTRSRPQAAPSLSASVVSGSSLP